MMLSDNFQKWISHPESLNKETLYELRVLLMRYPYCQLFRLLYLKNLYILHDVNFGVELRKAVLYIPNLKVLFYLIEGDKYIITRQDASFSFSEEAEEGQGFDRTLTLIDAFLSAVPQDEFSQINELDYTTDYTSYLLKDDLGAESEEAIESFPKLRGQDLIDGFIAKAETASVMKLGLSVEEEKKEAGESELALEYESEDDSYFTETLAKIYIKQRRYSKALEIIKKLSLKYPKKNVYFADQIRFLEKLIINANSK